jgi:hypothetical protein
MDGEVGSHTVGGRSGKADVNALLYLAVLGWCLSSFVVGRSALVSIILCDRHQQSQFIGASVIAISPSSQ